MKTRHLFLSLAFIVFSSGFILLQNTHPHVSISGKTSGVITLGEIIGQKLVVNKSAYVVESFKIVVGSGESVHYIDIAGDIVDKNASNLIRIQPSGTEIRVNNIVLSTLGKMTLAPDMKFVLIDKQ
jgi:hypothetical protein